MNRTSIPISERIRTAQFIEVEEALQRSAERRCAYYRCAGTATDTEEYLCPEHDGKDCPTCLRMDAEERTPDDRYTPHPCIRAVVRASRH